MISYFTDYKVLKTFLVCFFCLTIFSVLPRITNASVKKCITLGPSTFSKLNEWPDGIIVVSKNGLVLIKASRNFSGSLTRASRRALQRITKHLAIKDLGAFVLGENIFTYAVLSDNVVTTKKIKKGKSPVFERRQSSKFDEFIKAEIRGRVNEITELGYEVETAETESVFHSLYCIEYG